MQEELNTARCGCAIGIVAVIVSIINIFLRGIYLNSICTFCFMLLCLGMNLRYYYQQKKKYDHLDFF